MTDQFRSPGRCYCGHDCSRCLTYLATIRNDDCLRHEAQRFYKETFSIDLPLEEVACLGGRSEQICSLCQSCPFIRCCKEHAVEFCSDCPEYPCSLIAKYEEQYVNRCNQIACKNQK